jgi:hypothetical protein
LAGPKGNLSRHGFSALKDVTPAYAVKIFKAYATSDRKDAENPYRLVDDIWVLDLKMLIKFALKMGLKPQSIERIKAVFYTPLASNRIRKFVYITP